MFSQEGGLVSTLRFYPDPSDTDLAVYYTEGASSQSCSTFCVRSNKYFQENSVDSGGRQVDPSLISSNVLRTLPPRVSVEAMEVYYLGKPIFTPQQSS